MRVAVESTRNGGKVVLIGCGQDEMRLPLCSAAQREVDILGIFRYCHTYPTAIEMMASGRVDLNAMVTHRYGFSEEEVREGFEMAASGNAIKVMFNI